MGHLSLVSIGPGNLNYTLPVAKAALESADIIIGYTVYLDQLAPWMRADQQRIDSKLGSEIDRATQAIDMAASGKRVALVSSGDIGIYAMASPVYDVLRERGWDGSNPDVAVYPGVSAIQAVSAYLGAPLGHDFCTISLSDLLTPWEVIEKRVRAAAWGDFVIGFYNPRSRKRDWQLGWALDALRAERPPSTPVVIARNITRPAQAVKVTTLADIDPAEVDMFTLVLVGNSQSYAIGSGMATPRGYQSQPPAEENSVDKSHRETGATVYPIGLTKMAGARCVVVGGGPVGARKAQGLLDVGARVEVVSPDLAPALAQLAADGAITWHQRGFESADLRGAKLAFAATSDRDVNAAVAAVARTLGVLCTIADAPGEGDFHNAAVLRHKAYTVTVSSGGRGPGRSRDLRDKIAEVLQSAEATE